MAGQEQMVGRCYTKARRHPGMIGRWPGGGQIPGGPYTLQQASVAGAVFLVLFLSRGVWGAFGLGNYALLFVVPLVAAVLVRRVHIDGRSPVAVAVSLCGLALRGLGHQAGAEPRGGAAGGARWVCSVSEAGAGDPVVARAQYPAVAVEAAACSPAGRGGVAAPVGVRSGAAALLAQAGGRP